MSLVYIASDFLISIFFTLIFFVWWGFSTGLILNMIFVLQYEACDLIRQWNPLPPRGKEVKNCSWKCIGKVEISKFFPLAPIGTEGDQKGDKMIFYFKKAHFWHKGILKTSFFGPSAPIGTLQNCSKKCLNMVNSCSSIGFQCK